LSKLTHVHKWKNVWRNNTRILNVLMCVKEREITFASKTVMLACFTERLSLCFLLLLLLLSCERFNISWKYFNLSQFAKFWNHFRFCKNVGFCERGSFSQKSLCQKAGEITSSKFYWKIPMAGQNEKKSFLKLNLT
jgi:hypothetical protein